MLNSVSLKRENQHGACLFPKEKIKNIYFSSVSKAFKIFKASFQSTQKLTANASYNSNDAICGDRNGR